MINDTCDILRGSIYLYSFKNLTYGLRFLNSSNTFQEIKIMRICPIHYLPSSHLFGYCPVIQICQSLEHTCILSPTHSSYFVVMDKVTFIISLTEVY